MQDEYLRERAKEKGIVTPEDIQTVAEELGAPIGMGTGFPYGRAILRG